MPDKGSIEGKLQDRTGKRYKAILLATVLVFCIALGSLWRYNVYLNQLLNDDITTVGVMPFRIAGVNSLDAGFQSGLLENLVSQLSSFYGLQVLSSRATEPYAQSKQKPTEIGNELGVSHLLYGTFRQGQNDSIRINMELVDVRNGRNVWAKSVNRKPEDFFADPVDLSSDLAAFLEARENPYKDDDVEATARLSLTSYRLITEAREEVSRRTEEGFILANQLLEMAIARDSTLALGYALLSQNYSLMHAYGYMDSREALQNAEQNGGMSLYLDRNLAEGYVSNALMQYVFCLTPPQELLDLLQQAVLLRPSYDYAYHLMGKIYLDLQNYEMAVNYFSLAVKLNPDEFLYQKMLAATFEATGDVKKSRKLYSHLQAKFSDVLDVKVALLKYYLSVNDTRKTERLLKEIPDEFEILKTKLAIAIEKDQLSDAYKLIEEITISQPNADIGHLMVRYFDKKGEVEKVWAILDQAAENKQLWLKDIKSMKLRTVLNEPDRYQELLETVQLVALTEEPI